MADAKKKVLITGASGDIGGLTWSNLGDKYDFSGVNRSEVEGIPNTRASIANFDPGDSQRRQAERAEDAGQAELPLNGSSNGSGPKE